MTATPAFRHTGEPVCAAVATLTCGEDTHRVGVTVRGQAVMLDHDRKLERLAVGLEREARTACEEAYDHLRNVLAGTSTSPRTLNDDALEHYVLGAVGIRSRRQNSSSHQDRLVGISVLAGGPPHLRGDYREFPDSVVRQTLLRARQAAVERLIPELFLQTSYPILQRHRPPGPGVKRPACWHIQVGDLSPDQTFAVTTRPHPDDRHRACVSLTIPLAPTWYRDVYKRGLAVLGGELVVAYADPPPVGVWRATVLRQHGARFLLRDVEIVPDDAGGWRRSEQDVFARAPAPTAAGGTGARPSPWD